MKNIKKLVNDIHNGKNLRINLEKYRDLAMGAYHDYASLELVFSAYLLMDELQDEKAEYAKKEQKIVQRIQTSLCDFVNGEENLSSVIDKMSELRKEITEKMDLFTAYTDRLVCYEYVLNRMEHKYLSAKELDCVLKRFPQDSYMQQLMIYLFGSNDQAVITENIRTVIGQLPVRMTKAKFYERLSQTFTLYQGGEKSAFDGFLYMLRTSGMVYPLNSHHQNYKEFDAYLEKLESCDFSDLSEEEYNQLVSELEEVAKKIHEITDFYYSLQKVVNALYAACLCTQYDAGSSNVVADSIRALEKICQGEVEDELLIPFEGKIERYVEETSYLEAVLFEIRSAYHDELEQLAYVELFDAMADVANLLSGSLFVELEQQNEEIADETYIQSKTDELIEELDVAFANASKPVKRAMMGMILEKLPMVFKTSDEVKTYIEDGLFGCKDKAERAAVLDILSNLMQED